MDEPFAFKAAQGARELRFANFRFAQQSLHRECPRSMLGDGDAGRPAIKAFKHGALAFAETAAHVLGSNDERAIASSAMGVSSTGWLSEESPSSRCGLRMRCLDLAGASIEDEDAIARHDQAGNVDDVMGSRPEAGSVKARQVRCF